jgi:hypothetical protein
VRVNVIPVMVVAGISVLGEADAEPPGIPFPGGGLTRWGINGDLGAAQAAFAALDGLVLQLIAGVDEQGVGVPSAICGQSWPARPKSVPRRPKGAPRATLLGEP